jgi:hypothetical protein
LPQQGKRNAVFTHYCAVSCDSASHSPLRYMIPKARSYRP